MTPRNPGRTIAGSGFFVGGGLGMPKWRTRIVAVATTLLLMAVSLSGGSFELFQRVYLDW
jgi:hypothetical protein